MRGSAVVRLPPEEIKSQIDSNCPSHGLFIDTRSTLGRVSGCQWMSVCQMGGEQGELQKKIKNYNNLKFTNHMHAPLKIVYIDYICHPSQILL